MFFGLLDSIQSQMWMTGIAHLLMGDLTSFDFSGLSYVRCHIRAYSVLDEIYRSSWSCMLISIYELWTWMTRTTQLTVDDFVLSDFSTYHISDTIVGHISISIESYRSSWSYMITPTYRMHTETRTCSLFYHDPPVEPLLSYLVRPVFFSICMSSCFLFREMFPWRLGSIGIMEITHLMMDDFMSPDFQPTIYLMPY